MHSYYMASINNAVQGSDYLTIYCTFNKNFEPVWLNKSGCGKGVAWRVPEMISTTYVCGSHMQEVVF